MKILSKNLNKYINKNVSLKGWVYNSRRSGKIGFLTFRDGFGLLQCIVAKNDVGEEKFELFKENSSRTKICRKIFMVDSGNVHNYYVSYCLFKYNIIMLLNE